MGGVEPGDMRQILLILLLLAVQASAQTRELEVRPLDLPAEMPTWTGSEEEALRRQHDQAFRDLARILSSRQMAELRQMSRWGRYGPEPGDAAAGEALLEALTGPARMPAGLWPTVRQQEAFLREMQSGANGLETRLLKLLTPSQVDFLRELERMEQSEL